MNPMEIFQKESPDVTKAFDTLIDALKVTDGLDNKTNQLVYIALQASSGNSTAIHYHIPMAKKEGPSGKEIEDAILTILTICGLKGVTSCLSTALEIENES